MLRAAKNLDGMAIGATDDEIGRIKDAYFDDQDWTLRYLVVDTGGWLSGRRVLITPLSIRDTNWGENRIEVALTRKQVEESPGIDTDKPVSRQHEGAFYDYYGYSYYWAGPFLWGPMAFPRDAASVGADPNAGREVQRQQDYDPHLRSLRDVTGYHIAATDDSIGHVEDFLYDEETWSLRYLLIDTRNWLPGKHVLVSTEWIERVSWSERSVHVALTRDAVRASPEYDPDALLTTQYEDQLYRHYGRRPARHWSRGSNLA